MQKHSISYAETAYFSQIILDYLAELGSVRPFYHLPANKNGIAQAIEQIQLSYTAEVRQQLCDTLQAQYAPLLPAPKTQAQLKKLALPHTFTVTTAHQPNIFGGPLYIIYKILATIRLAQQLETQFPDCHFVPIYWMGSEDHDFEEINHIHLFQKTLTWQQNSGGSVGRLSNETLLPVIEQLRTLLGNSTNAQRLLSYIDQSYSQSTHLAQATQKFLHLLFGEYGLVIVQQDDAALKNIFLPIMKNELLYQPTYVLAQQTNQQLAEQGYHQQAFARPINLFYLTANDRQRIVYNADSEQYSTESQRWTQLELMEELDNQPSRFSPNVFLRPTYQQCVLPNIVYLGGGGELAYWLQQRQILQHHAVFFPILVLRPSVLWIDTNSSSKLQKLGIAATDLFRSTEQLISDYVRQNSPNTLDFNVEKAQLQQLFEQIHAKSIAIDASLQDAVAAEATKTQKAIDNLEQKLRRAEKRKYDTSIEQIQQLKQKLFPNNSLQERYDNFMPYYLKYGSDFFDYLLQHFDPLHPSFLVVEDIL